MGYPNEGHPNLSRDKRSCRQLPLNVPEKSDFRQPREVSKSAAVRKRCHETMGGSMAYDLKSIPLDELTLEAASRIMECFYAAGADLSSSKLLELKADYGIKFAEAADALSAHRLYLASLESTG